MGVAGCGGCSCKAPVQNEQTRVGVGVTGAGACPRGRHCRLAACPGDRILRSRVRIRSRIPGSNHLAFQSLAAVASGQVSGSRLMGSARSLSLVGASPALGAPTTSALCIDCTASTPPHRPIKFFAYNYFDCRHLGSPCCLYAHVSHAPRIRQQPSIFFTCAPRFERVSLTRGDGWRS
jgi:hypothetical protein